MMKTTHILVHRLKILLERFKEKPKLVYAIMYEIKEQQEHSAEVEQTVNPDRTDSEKSDDDQEKGEASELGLKNERASEEDQEEEVKVEE